MRIEKIILIILIIIGFSFTKKTSKPSNVSLERISNPKKLKSSINFSDTLKIKFEDFELVIDSLSIWDEEEKLKNTQKDTAVIHLELGETIEGRKIQIVNKLSEILTISQRFENSITIMNEGPHCDLRDWKHYYSEWIKLPIINNEIITNNYSQKDWEKFNNVDIKELKEAVSKQCGERWVEHVKNIKSPNEYPSGVSTSRIFLKIEFKSAGKDQIQKRIISFELPMGC